jgi:hypothetical protein
VPNDGTNAKSRALRKKTKKKMKMRSWNSGSFAFTTDQNKSRGNGNIFETERGRPENNKKNRKRIQTTAQVATHNRTISFDRWLAVLAAGWMLMVVSPYASSSFRKHITAAAATRAEIAQQERMMMMAAIIIICLDRCCEPPLHDDRAHLLF